MSLPPGLSALFNLRPERAADFLAAKGLRLSGPYWALDGPAHARNFTVARLAKLEVLADIRDAVQAALDGGKTERWFRAHLESALREKGWWGPRVEVDPDTLEARIVQQGSRRRLQTIYRTNLQSAYMAGRHAQALEQSARAPYAQYLAVRDSRTRPAHAALHGKVFRLDSPEWAVVSPPNGYNCRCRARYLSGRALDRRGLKPEEDVRILERPPPGRTPLDPLTGETPARWVQRGVSVPDPLRPGERAILWADPGWDHLPGSDGAERALVDKLLQRATALGDGMREVVVRGLATAAASAATPPIHAAAAAARADCVEFGRAHRRERLIFLDEPTGRELAREDGAGDFVNFTPEMIRLAVDPASRIRIVHNHPSSMPLSPQDLGLLAKPGVSVVEAAGHAGLPAGQAGSVYRVTADRAGFAARSRGAYAGAVGDAMWAASDSIAPVLWPEVRSGALTPREAGQIHFHALALAMERAGLLRYEAILNAGDARLMAGHVDAIESAVVAAANAASTWLHPL
jgi:SPP1 gp7 family putative phage head morphogenesis protein